MRERTKDSFLLEISELTNTIKMMNQNTDRLWAEKEFLRQKILIQNQEKHVPVVVTAVSQKDFHGKTDGADNGKVEEIIVRAQGEFNDLLQSLNMLSRSLPSIRTNLFQDSLNNENLQKMLDKEQKEKLRILEENENLSWELKNLKREMNEFSTSVLDKTVGENEQLVMELKSTRKQLGELLDAEDEYILRIRKLESELESAATELEHSRKNQEHVTRLNHVISQGARDYEKLQENLDSTRIERDKIRGNLLEKELENMNLKNKLQGINRSISRRDKETLKSEFEHKEKVNGLNSRIDNLSDEIEDLSKRLLESENELLSEKKNSNELVLEVNTLRIAVEDLEKASQVLSVENENLKKELDESLIQIEELEGDIEGMEDSLLLLEENATELEKRLGNTKFDQVLSEVAELEQFVSSVKKSEGTGSSSGITTDPGIDSPQGSEDSDEIEMLRQEVKHLTIELEDLKKEYDEITDKYILASEDSDNLKNEITRISSEFEKLNLEKAFLQDENEGLKSQKSNHEELVDFGVEGLENRISELSGELRLAREASDSYYHALAQEKAKSASLTAELAVAGTSSLGDAVKQQIIEQMTIIENSMDDLEDSLQLEETRLAKYCYELGNVQDSVSDEFEHLNVMIQKLESQIENMSMLSLSGDSEDTTVLKRQLEASQVQLSQLNAQLGTLETDLIVYQARQGQMDEISSIIDSVRQNLEIMGLMQASEDLKTVVSILSEGK
ncbi:MAG: hypothetical protein JXR95_03920 [Deltaproteobacteria bacterium]|nr:hypothetical protein [Deltaproteobacteria bacterium]